MRYLNWYSGTELWYLLVLSQGLWKIKIDLCPPLLNLNRKILIVAGSLFGSTNLLYMWVITFKSWCLHVSWKANFTVTLSVAIDSWFCFPLVFLSYFPNVTGDETLRGLSIKAAQRALEMAKVKAEDVDLVLLCTSTPDDLFGGATQVSCNIYLSVMAFAINILENFVSTREKPHVALSQCIETCL
jgi:hypothetical protein